MLPAPGTSVPPRPGSPSSPPGRSPGAAPARPPPVSLFLRAAAVGAGLILAARLPAQDPPRLRIGRAREAPVIDGLLQEKAWEGATRIPSFTEVDPVEGRPGDPPTEVFLMRDAENLYLGFRAWEPRVEDMVLQNMRRDAFLNDDDRFEFILDTFHDRRTAYWFQISAAGSRGDALISDNGARFNKRWDTRWEGRTRVLEDRWEAEIRIPFRVLGFGDQPVWGVNFERFRGPGRVRLRWAGAVRSNRLFTVSAAGEMEGLEGIERGSGWELVPYFKTRYAVNETDADSDLFGAIGGEINWTITPELAGSLTLRTDFAETETDERQVNLGRFPLFFPEKRDFFLQDSHLFEFGEQSGFRGSNNLVPFFSRRIGLVEGEEVPIDAGLRLAGRAGPMDLGLLAVHTGVEASLAVPAADLFVFRPSFRVADGLSLGGLLTAGSPESEAQNLVTGLDLRYSSTELLDGNLNLNLYGLRSSDEATQAVGGAWGAQLRFDQTDWQYSLATLATDAEFEPALGFVRRPGEHRYQGSVVYQPRQTDSETIRRYYWDVRPEVWTDQSGDLTSYNLRFLLFGVEWETGDELDFRVFLQGDNPDRAFSPVDGSTITAGDYDWERASVRFNLSDARPVNGSVQFSHGTWYDGTRSSLRLDAGWKPDAHLRLLYSYRQDHADIPGGDFTTRIQILNLDYAFSPDLTWENLVQVDNASDLLGLQSRLRYIEEDGRELFLVLNSAWQELPGGVVVPEDRDLTLKIVYSILF